MSDWDLVLYIVFFFEIFLSVVEMVEYLKSQLHRDFKKKAPPVMIIIGIGNCFSFTFNNDSHSHSR